MNSLECGCRSLRHLMIDELHKGDKFTAWDEKEQVLKENGETIFTAASDPYLDECLIPCIDIEV